MHGNVYELCRDWYGEYPSGVIVDPVGAAEGSGRVLRGGGWGNDGQRCRSANRGGSRPDYRNGGLGFPVGFSSDPENK
jgi:formylglycine-generating enzyme